MLLHVKCDYFFPKGAFMDCQQFIYCIDYINCIEFFFFFSQKTKADQ